MDFNEKERESERKQRRKGSKSFETLRERKMYIDKFINTERGR